MPHLISIYQQDTLQIHQSTVGDYSLFLVYDDT